MRPVPRYPQQPHPHAPQAPQAPPERPPYAFHSHEEPDPVIEEAPNDLAAINSQALDLPELKEMDIAKLNKIAKETNIQEYSGVPRQELISKIVAEHFKHGGLVRDEGVLEVLPDGYGFLRSEESNYLPGPNDIYVSPSQIKRFGLRKGHLVKGYVRSPKDSERFNALLRVEAVNASPPEVAREKILFDNLTPYFPTRKIQLEGKVNKDRSMRIMDMFTPIGFGQRGLIVAPPRTGKTILIQQLAKVIIENHPDVILIVLLIDERPEEVTDMKRTVCHGSNEIVRAERPQVIASTFDERPERHVQVSNMVLEKAKRLVEYGKDVVILLDSITRLARAHNTVAPHSGRILSGGVDAQALYEPKRFFGAARNIEGAGTLTIIATALIETGSRMDEVIFEEFKGTGNMEMVLDRKRSDMRQFPAIDLYKSGTRKEELLLDPGALLKLHAIRRVLPENNVVSALNFVAGPIDSTKSNADFFKRMNQK